MKKRGTYRFYSNLNSAVVPYCVARNWCTSFLFWCIFKFDFDRAVLNAVFETFHPFKFYFCKLKGPAFATICIPTYLSFLHRFSLNGQK